MTQSRFQQHSKLRCGGGLTFVERFQEQCERLARLQQLGPLPGTIWNSQPEHEEELFGPPVLVFKILETDRGEKQLLVAEVSEDLEQATDSDLVMLPHESGLPFRCIVRAGNKFWITSDCLKDPLGEIQTSIWPLVLQFCSSPEEFDYQISPLDYFFLDLNGLPVMCRAGVTSGLPFRDENDPRLVLLEESIQKCRYLSNHPSMRGKQCRLANHKQAFD